jgi:hypothetical protein
MQRNTSTVRLCFQTVQAERNGCVSLPVSGNTITAVINNRRFDFAAVLPRSHCILQQREQLLALQQC